VDRLLFPNKVRAENAKTNANRRRFPALTILCHNLILAAAQELTHMRFVLTNMAIVAVAYGIAIAVPVFSTLLHSAHLLLHAYKPEVVRQRQVQLGGAHGVDSWGQRRNGKQHLLMCSSIFMVTCDTGKFWVYRRGCCKEWLELTFATNV